MDQQEFSSYEILKRYSELKCNNDSCHEAYVLGTACGNRNFNAVLFVCVILDVHNQSGEIVIEGNNQYYNCHFKSQYSTDNSRFKLIRNTLIIKGTDEFGNDIALQITAK